MTEPHPTPVVDENRLVNILAAAEIWWDVKNRTWNTPGLGEARKIASALLAAGVFESKAEVQAVEPEGELEHGCHNHQVMATDGNGEPLFYHHCGICGAR